MPACQPPPKDVLRTYLQGARDMLLWRLDGLSERDVRLPRTPTGMNLLGIVKHALHTAVLCFGPTFGRAWATPEELVAADETDSQADWYATAHESAAGLVDLYRRVHAFADETIDALPLDAAATSRTGEDRRSRCTRSWCTRSSTCSGTRVTPTSCASRSTERPGCCGRTATSRPMRTGRPCSRPLTRVVEKRRRLGAFKKTADGL